MLAKLLLNELFVRAIRRILGVIKKFLNDYFYDECTITLGCSG
ncbi:MAG: hypothetical protein JWR50_930 [Mucilaginibacter sp.]|nr:hypothetical protein [Mucilaginibacter sp.]